MKTWLTAWRNNRRYGFSLLSAWRETWRDWHGIRRMNAEIASGLYGTVEKHRR